MSNMYDNTGTWNPFVGCKFNCKYCEPSFQRQLKRWAKGNCEKCYNYEPHKHPERLDTSKIPSDDIIFPCGNSDIAFAPVSYIKKIISVIEEHNKRCPGKTYYFQSKEPTIFQKFKDELPHNAVILTTIETNREMDFSDAPSPFHRYNSFRKVDYMRKVLVVEPVADFDLKTFSNWIISLDLEYLWFGFNSKPNEVKIPEPSIEKAQKLVDKLQENNIEVKGKTLRDVNL